MPLNKSGLTRGLSRGPADLDANERIVPGLKGYVEEIHRVKFLQDFIVDTLETAPWLTEVEADVTSPSTVAIAEEAGGVLKLSLGAVANDFALAATPKVFSTSNPGRIDVKVKVTTGANAIDNLVFGLSDAKTESNGNLITNFSSVAVVPDDFLGWGTNGTNWYMCAAKNTVDVATLVATSLVPAPSTTYQKLSFEWSGGDIKFFLNDVQVGTLISTYRTGQVLCFIAAACHVGGTGNPVVTIDYVEVNQDR